MTSEAFQMVKNETLQESLLKFDTTDEGQNFQIKKSEQYGIMEDRINKLPKTRNCNVLISKLRPVQDFKSWIMTFYRSFVKLGNNLAPHN